MSAIGPGDFVECIDASPERITGAKCSLVLGNLYVVEAVWHLTDIRDGLVGCAIDLVGVARPWDNTAFGLHRFKPILRPKPDAFTRLLETPTEVREPAHA